MVEKTILIPSLTPTAPAIDEINAYRQKMDSIMVAFQHTFLVKEEASSLERFKISLKKYDFNLSTLILEVSPCLLSVPNPGSESGDPLSDPDSLTK